MTNVLPTRAANFPPAPVPLAGLSTAGALSRRRLRTPRADPAAADGGPPPSAAQLQAVTRAAARLREEEPE